MRNLVRQLYEKPEYKAHVQQNGELQKKVSDVLSGTAVSDSGDTAKASSEVQANGGLSRSKPGTNNAFSESLDLFMSCILNPLKRMSAHRPTSCGHVLVVDSLDEALLVEGGDPASVVRMLQTCYAKGLFPPWLKVLATSRNIDELRQMSAWRRVELSEASLLYEANQSIRKYINQQLESTDSRLLVAIKDTVPHSQAKGDLQMHRQPEMGFSCSDQNAAHFDKLVQQSAGNFLYAVTAIRSIREGSSLLSEASLLPNGLKDLFLHFFRRLFGESSSSSNIAAVRLVFEVMLASYRSVSEVVIIQCIRIASPDADDSMVQHILQSVRQFLKPVVMADETCSKTCKKGHAMSGWTRKYGEALCNGCGKSVSAGFGCKDCQYDLCHLCCGDIVSIPRDERLVFYHLSFQQWLCDEGRHFYDISCTRGHKVLAVVMLSSFSKNTSAFDDVALTLVEQLDFKTLSARTLRKVKSAVAKSAGALDGCLPDLVRHLGKAADAEGGDFQALGEMLRSCGVDLEQVDVATAVETCACQVARLGDIHALRILHGYGACLDYTASQDWGLSPPSGPLHCAAKGGHVGVMRFLVDEVGVDARAPDMYEQTALHIASHHGHVEAVRFLVSQPAGVDLESGNAMGDTALYTAAWRGHSAVLSVLITEGANTSKAS